MNSRRIKQVIRYGWNDSKKISHETGKNHIVVFSDILFCFARYKMWSNHYVKEKMYKLSNAERRVKGKEYFEKGKTRDDWDKDFDKNRDFFIKYGGVKYDKLSLRDKRNLAYANRYNAGNHLFVQYDVHISRNHYLNGTIKIGNDVKIAKHVFIDYSGFVEIGDNVTISDGVMIESHDHPTYTNPSIGENKVNQMKIVIEDGVILGNRVIVNSSVGKIGRNARIGAGSVLRNSVPPYAIVMGNPAKIVGFSMTPEQVEAYEKEYYKEEERISLLQYAKDYNKFFINRIDDIKKFLRK